MTLGMLDPPTMVKWNYVTNKTDESNVHLKLALTAAQKGICMYKNGRDVLPLNTQNIKKLALIGPQVCAFVWVPERGVCVCVYANGSMCVCICVRSEGCFHVYVRQWEYV